MNKTSTNFEENHTLKFVSLEIARMEISRAIKFSSLKKFKTLKFSLLKIYRALISGIILSKYQIGEF